MAKTVVPMYRLKPVQQEHCVFNYNSNMYAMKNLVETALSLKTGSGQSNDTVIDDKTYEEVERSQAVIFEYIRSIKKQIEELKRILLKRSEGAAADVKKVSDDMSQPNCKAAAGTTHQLVVNADIDNPPYSLLALHHVTKQLVSLNVTVHRHSSLSSLPENLERFNEIKSHVANPKVTLNIVLIWKDGGGTCVAPGYVPLTGEVSLLRLVQCLLQEEVNASVDTQLQQVLDDINNCELSVLESAVKGTQYLVNNRLSVADLALWSRLKYSQRGKLQQWFQHYDKLLS